MSKIEKLAVPAALASLYVLSLRGRRNHPGLEELCRWRYAHRGLHNAERPENSLAAFQAAVDGGFGAELDVHLLKDGTLAVLHDSALTRVTGQFGVVEDLTGPELKNYRLNGTEQTIPELKSVLEIFAGKAPLIIELKTYRKNHAALSAAVCEALRDYNGPYCLESFDPLCVYWLKKHRPDLIRGQLSENFARNGSPYPLLVRCGAAQTLENFLTEPDFIAYKFEDRRTLSNLLSRKVWGLQGVSWTLRTPRELETAEAEGWIPIFEGFVPAPGRTENAGISAEKD